MTTANMSLWISLVAFLLGVHIFLRLALTKLGENDKFFTSPNLGRIKARIRSGRIIGYIGNLTGYNKHVDEKDGAVVIGEADLRWWDTFWMVYGVRFMGLDNIKEYPLNITVFNGNDAQGIPQVSKAQKNAHSVHYQGSYYLFLTNVATDGNSEINILLGYSTETVHAGKTLKYTNWIEVVERALASFTREHFSTIPMDQANKIKVELGKDEKESFVRKLRTTLNTGTEGNPGLDETVGQIILTANIISIDYSDKRVQEQAQANELEKQKVATSITAAEGRFTVSKIDAKAAIELNKPVVKLLEESAEAVGGGENLAAIREADSLGKLEKMPGVIVWKSGGSTPPVILDSKGGKT